MNKNWQPAKPRQNHISARGDKTIEDCYALEEINKSDLSLKISSRSPDFSFHSGIKLLVTNSRLHSYLYKMNL